MTMESWETPGFGARNPKPREILLSLQGPTVLIGDWPRLPTEIPGHSF